MASKATAAAGVDASETPDSKSARTRQRILDAAAHVLSRKGYSGTRLGDVAREANIQAPAIYYYFESREQLVEEVMWVGVARMDGHLREVLKTLPAKTSPLERIEAAVEAHLRYVLEMSDYTTAAIRNAGQVPEEIRTRQLREEARYGELWRKLIKEADDNGDLRPELDVRIARMLVLGALNWAAEWWNPRKGTMEDLVRTAQKIVRHGLSGADDPPKGTGRASR